MKKVFFILYVFSLLCLLVFSEHLNANAFSGIKGRMMSISDVMGAPDIPITDIVVVAAPREKFDPWFESLELSSQYPHFEKGQMKPFLVLATPNTKGFFEQLLPPGEYIVCFTRDWFEEDIFVFDKCGKVEVASNEVVRINYDATQLGSRISVDREKGKWQGYILPYKKERRIKSVTLLDYQSPSWYSKININPGFVQYSDQQTGREKPHHPVTYFQFKGIRDALKENTFFSLNAEYGEVRPKAPQQRISVYTDTDVMTVSCSLPECPDQFINIKNEIEKIWHANP